MSTRELRVELPDELAQEAEAQGLLTPEAIERMIRGALRQRRVDRLFAAADRLAILDLPLTDADVAAEVQAARAARRADADRR